MGLCDEVRRRSAEIAAEARHVRIDLDALDRIEPGPPPALDPERHYLEGEPEDVAAYLLTLDSVNFGSGWFPTLNKRPGCSGYFTVAWALADQFRANGPWSPDELTRLDAEAVALTLDQDPGHELMGLYAQALNDLGRFLEGRTALQAVQAAGGSAERLAETLAHAMPFFDDTGFWKRAQITANDLALAEVAEFEDLDRLTIFADNLVPHVLRMDGVLVYEPALAELHRLGAPAPAGPRGAGDPRLRRARVRADRGAAGRAATDSRRLALDPGPGAALQGAPAAPHPQRLLLARFAPRLFFLTRLAVQPSSPLSHVIEPFASGLFCSLKRTVIWKVPFDRFLRTTPSSLTVDQPCELLPENVNALSRSGVLLAVPPG